MRRGTPSKSIKHQVGDVELRLHVVRKWDGKRCRTMLHSGIGGGFHQCHNTAKTKSGFCGVHDPERLALRKAGQSREWILERQLWKAKGERDKLQSQVWDALREPGRDDIPADIRRLLDHLGIAENEVAELVAEVRQARRDKVRS